VTPVNKPGGGGAVSVSYLNQHAGDAHYIAINSPNLIANDINGRSPAHYTELTALANLFSEYTVIAVRADSPVRSGHDFIDRLRKDPPRSPCPLRPRSAASITFRSRWSRKRLAWTCAS
jgi:putative tricarboxylic transport membrane protein